MKTATRGILLAVAFASLCFAGPMLTFTGGSYATHGYDQTVGWQFTVNSSITVNELYWYDPNDEIIKAFSVAIWDNAGTEVVSPTDVGFGAGTWDNASGYWGTSIAAVTLNAGTYVIGGLIAPADLIIANATGLATDPAITFLEARASWGTSIQEPGGGQAQGAGYFGPNFGAAPSGVPEPGTWALLAIGLISLAVSRRRAA